MNKFVRSVKLNIASLAIPAAVCVVICAFILTGITFSWFSSTVNASTNTITSGSFKSTVDIYYNDETVDELTGSPISTPISVYRNDTTGYFELTPGKTYFVTFSAAAEIDGWVELHLYTDSRDICVWSTQHLDLTLEEGIISQTVTFTVDSDITANVCRFRLVNCWQQPNVPPFDGIVNINQNTYNSASIVDELNSRSTMDLAPAYYHVDAVSGFLYEVFSGTYYNAETGAQVEPTTGYAYDENGNLVHPESLRACRLDDFGQLIDVETGFTMAQDSGYPIDPDWQLEIDPNGYLIDRETGNLIDRTTGFYVIEESDYQIIPATGFLYNAFTNTYHDPFTYDEVLSDVALGIVPPIEEDVTTSVEDQVFLDDSEVTTEDTTTVFEELLPEISEETTATEIVYNYIEGYYFIPDTLNYQLSNEAYVDSDGIVHRYLYNTVDMTVIDLCVYSADYIDPVTFYYVIPGSNFRIIPATGYLFDSVAVDPNYAYINPVTMMYVTYDEAHGILPEETTVTEATDAVTDPSTEASTEASTEESTETSTEATTEATTQPTEETTVTTTVTEATTSETNVTEMPQGPTTSELAVTTAPETEAEVTTTTPATSEEAPTV